MKTIRAARFLACALAPERKRIAVAAGMNSPLWPIAKTTARVVVFGVSS